MREIDLLAAAVVEAVAHIIALPQRIAVWVAKAARRSLKRPHGVGLGQWKKTGSRKSRKQAAKKDGSSPSALDDFKLKYEDVPDKKAGGKNAIRRSRNNK